MSETELRLFADQMSAELIFGTWEIESMKLALFLASLTAGSYAAIWSALQLIEAAKVFSIGG